MFRKVCIMEVSNDLLPTLLGKLPPDVRVADKHERLDRAATVVKLEGDGLPPWCNEPPDGGLFAQVSGVVEDGVLRFVPVGVYNEYAGSMHERIAEQYAGRN